MNRVPLREQIRRLLLDRLLSGAWAPGQRIVERHLAAELRVSQAPVREALRELEALRLVETVPNKGARVRAVSLGELAESYPVRAGLEEVAAELALPRLAGARAESLRELADAMDRAAEAGDVPGRIRHGVAFHRAIVAASGNQVLSHAWEALGVGIWATLAWRWFGTEPHEDAAGRAAIVEAFRRRDAAAPRLLREHVLAHTPRQPAVNPAFTGGSTAFLMPFTSDC
ncbi:GntR family transcriptional regulator [Allostreptomyces psammosilenae]|uniref:GntR family transcriptional regulator n=1 Tax=Allostreptomyces psammosilenae TaxID=1892865 RepID=UPI001FE807FF|nr:GntR family transcriptional regulator [Allostreptomyces psammosilenae]